MAKIIYLWKLLYKSVIGSVNDVALNFFFNCSGKKMSHTIFFYFKGCFVMTQIV